MDESCLVSSAQKTLEGIIAGDRKFKIPPLNPLILPLVEIFGPAMNVSLRNLSVDGLANSKIKSVKIDTANKIGEVSWDVDKIILTGDYDLNGRILFLTLQGADKANITVEKCNILWKFYYELIEKKREKYGNITKFDTDFKVESATIQLNEIFRGNELLSKEHINVIIFDELAIGIKAAIGAVFNMVTTGFFSKIPFDKLLKP
ncbi:uncharacterized protein LOC126264817 [Aethina tumida]|uniref:uncharacterized protein LOC126264817 n=1 Tax=Aethina tumida TaxID=116153 RepID=UPI0021483953|nr:uncharacterized protein LOC126264817 [Aethina tumida]